MEFVDANHSSGDAVGRRRGGEALASSPVGKGANWKVGGDCPARVRREVPEVSQVLDCGDGACGVAAVPSAAPETPKFAGNTGRPTESRDSTDAVAAVRDAPARTEADGPNGRRNLEIEAAPFPLCSLSHFQLAVALAFSLATCWSLRAMAAAWPQFRGPGGSGVAADGDFPTHFGPTSNVVWKVALPAGHSSPIVWGNRVFLTAFADGKLKTLCLDRTDGQSLWTREVEPSQIEKGSHLSHPAASTPATDGQRVYVYFGAFGLVSYDFAGAQQWRRPLPTPVTQHGASSSPVVAGDRVVLCCDQDVGSYLLAVSARGGETLWQTDRPGFRRGFVTPLLWPPQQPTQAIIAGTLRLVAYELQTGRERWSVRGLPNEMVASPVVGDDLIFVAGWTHGSGVQRMPDFVTLLERGDQNADGKLTRDEAPPGPAKQHFLYIDADKDGFITREEYEPLARIFDESKNTALAVRPGDRGDVTDTHVVWRHTRGLPYVPSPLFYEGRLYLVKNGGLATCLEAQTGKAFYQEERLGALGDYYSSPVAANGKLCVASQPGVVVVYRAGDTLEVLARNELGEQILATPAIVEDKLYVRTSGHLYCFGAEASAVTGGPGRGR